jgi:hypothetical protein
VRISGKPAEKIQVALKPDKKDHVLHKRTYEHL